CAIETVCPGDHLVTMSEGGQIMRTRVEDISVVGRNTMGVIVMDVEEDDRVASVDVIPETIVAAENVELEDVGEVEE
ncbi:MAG TPA: DNA gyrase C-terminal beta-propeller domain-containing protein, partial [Halobacteriales archaeon]|nr:DNA gyrase C-terminal beta-propeller domain-containing protein [Halobacteriales archaeon]